MHVQLSGKVLARLGRHATDMVGHRVGHIQSVPSEKTSAPRQVGVFAVAEKILVKDLTIHCNIVEEFTSIKRRGCRDAKYFSSCLRRLQTRLSVADVQVASRPSHPDSPGIDLPRWLDRLSAASKQYPGSRTESRPLSPHLTQQRSDVIALEKHVRVEGEYPIPIRSSNALIGRGGQPPIGLVGND